MPVENKFQEDLELVPCAVNPALATPDPREQVAEVDRGPPFSGAGENGVEGGVVEEFAGVDGVGYLERELRRERFRTLGGDRWSGAVDSAATTPPRIIEEMLLSTTSERQGRVIDQDEGGAGMEEKKKRGYF